MFLESFGGGVVFFFEYSLFCLAVVACAGVGVAFQ
jgi:hypothetical protein